MNYWYITASVLFIAVCAAAAVFCFPSTTTVIGLPPPPVTLLFVGDVMLARSVGDAMAARDDWLWPFARIASVTRAADLAFANLETTVATRGTASGCGYCFRADPKAVAGLVYVGFDVLSVANNHSHDYGPDALSDTLRNLRTNGISPVGDNGPIVKTVRGTRIAYLAYSEPINTTRMASDIVQARAMADVLIVSVHAGTEYEPVHNATQERISHAAIDAGADLVIGTHPHVVQDMERYNGKWIAYSLGNFVFDQNWSDATRHGLMLTVKVRDGHIADITQTPIEISKQYQVLLP